jgi:HlyD family secretion protein
MQVQLSLNRSWRTGRARLAAGAVAMAVLSSGAVWVAQGADPQLESRPPIDADVAASHARVVVAATGRVEGASETIELGAGLDGVIAEVRVREGDRVRAGDVLAVIDRRELTAELGAAQAAAEAARQARRRLLRGSREEDRERADAEVAAAAAVRAEAQSQQERSKQLFAEGVISAAQRDEARRVLDVSEAQLAAARKRAELVKAPPLPEEAAAADADVRSAQERVRALEQTLEKTFVRAPIAGTVLQTLLKPGESFSTLVPRPILSMADTSRLRVRAEVDERDVGRVAVGQRVLVRGDGWEDPGVPGVVTRLGAEMGRKTARSGDPAEKSDRDVLEVLVDLDHPDRRLVFGLRVTARFLNEISR